MNNFTNLSKITTLSLVLLLFSFNYAKAQYCTPKFFFDWSDTGIIKVSTSGAVINLNNSSLQNPNGYGDYSATHSVTAIAGTDFTLSVTYQSCWMRVSVWIDSNNNFAFEDSERVIALDAVFSSQSGQITAPSQPGSYRIRVMGTCDEGDLLDNPCIANGYEGEAEDYTLIVVTQNPCSGTPSAGSITVNPSKENAGNTYTVSATGQSLIDFDYTYQWRSNTNGSGWVNVGVATTTYADLVQTANPTAGTIVEYRLVITCTNSGLSDTSNVVPFLTHKKYCFPQNPLNSNTGGLSNTARWIDDFTTSGGIVNISNLSTGRSPNGYADYSATHQAMFNATDNVDFNVNVKKGSGFTPWNFGIWVDWNNDGNLDLSERVYISPSLILSNTLTTSGSFEIPPGTPQGMYRMRIIEAINNPLDETCLIAAPSGADVEDYSLVVVSSACLPPIQLNSTPNSLTNTTLSWEAVGNETNFEVQWGDEYFALGTGTTINGITTNSTDINTITDKVYEFYVRTDCGSGNYSAWVGPFKFYTGYCIPEYLALAYSITNFEITGVATNLINAPGVSDFYDPASVYSNFSNLYADAYENTTLSYNLKSNLSGQVRINIWVDWNKNGVFETDEILSNVVSSTTHFQFYPNGYNGTLTLPSTITPGDYRLRVKMVWYVNNQPVNVDPCAAYSNAQTQDYTLRIVPTPCVVSIPDANFKAYLVGNTAINTNGDTEIQCSEATAFTGTINCSNQNIANLTGIEAFVNITELRCHQNQLTSLDVSNNVNITTLRCYTNQLTTLDVSNNVNLTRLYCQDNQLTTLDVSSNDLEYLWCYDNQLTSLNVSNNTTMERLLCYDNQLTTLDVSDLTVLLRLETANNQLTSLNISSNTSLNRLECNNNELTSLNLKNGNNLNFVTLDAKNNPNLACIEVDDVAYSNISWADKKDAWASFSEDCGYTQPCVVNIPDANFKAYLVGNTAINTNGDTEIQCDEATAFAGTISCTGQNIADLSGIEAFVNITQLSCQNNQLTSLDLSNNTALTNISCQNNQLSSLNVSNNIALTQLQCQSNQLTSLDLSNNTALTNLSCAVNNLTNLDLSNNTALTSIICSTNNLTSLDLSNNTALTQLRCPSNQLTSLDLSNNTALTEVTCNSNQLTSLDVSSNSALSWFRCQGNQLTSLNLKNGNNTNINTLFFNLTNNPNLSCIEVDDVAYSNANWSSYKDATASFSEDCSACIVTISDANFKNALLTHTPVIDTNNDGEIQCDEATAFTGLLNVSAKGIADLTGIEAFVNITGLNCSLNQLTSLNVGNNTALTTLNCNGIASFFNQIAALDVSNNTALTELQCEGNLLSSLNVSNNTALTKLWCGGNQLTALDVSSNTALTEFRCFQNQLTALDLSNNTALTILNCNENQLTSLDVSSNTALTELRCIDNQLTTLNVSNNTALLQLWCGENQVTSLDVSNNTALVWLICPDNQLTSLDTSNNAVLEYLICNENQITSLDVSNNTALKGVECIDNQLTSLNVKNGNNSNFLFFGATDNPNLYCIEVDNVAYSNVTWANFKDATACFSDVACITPTFDLPASVCQGVTAPVLPALSGNIVSGSWSPATIDTSNINTQTYTFTPTLCANPYQIEISVVATPDAPTGEANQTFNAGQTLADLVVNGTNLVWSSSSTFSDTLSDSEPLVNGMTYYVRSENGNCQSDFLAITVTLTVNVSDFDVFGFSYYPNPVNDILHFSSNQPIENVVVSNMLGQQIKTNLNSDKTSLDLSNLPSGNYLVKITIEGVAKMIKVVKR